MYDLVHDAVGQAVDGLLLCTFVWGIFYCVGRGLAAWIGRGRYER